MSPAYQEIKRPKKPYINLIYISIGYIINREALTYILSINALVINKDNKVKKKVSFNNLSKIIK